MKKIILASMFLFFIGCTGNVPLTVNSRNVDRVIIEGKTLKSDVIRNFGRPLEISKSNEGLEVWKYKRNGNTFILTFEGEIVKRHIVY